MAAIDILKRYKLRFQIEFLYQAAHQFTGLEQCQARSREKIDFHVNASLKAVSLARAVHCTDSHAENLPAFSMANLRVLYHNDLIIKKFISLLGIDPNEPKNKEKLNQIANFGALAT